MTVKWYSGGQDRARVAVGIISDLVANLNTTNEQPLRQLLATYYQELLEQRTGSVLGVFDRMNLDISKCLRQQQIKLSPENEQLMQQLMGLNMIHYRWWILKVKRKLSASIKLDAWQFAFYVKNQSQG